MKNKSPYVKPTADVTIIEIEYALATGSAQVLADDGAFKIYEEWTDDNEVRRTIDW